MPKGFRKNRRRSNRGSKNPKMSFSKRVLSVVNKQRELKCGNPLQYSIGDVRDGITAITRPTNVLNLLPAIPQGTEEFMRVGNKITLKKIVMRGYYRLTFPVGNVTSTRVLIRNLILRQRNFGDAYSITAGITPMNYNTLLEPARSYLGIVDDYNTPINRDSFVVKKQFKRIMTCEYDGVVLPPSAPALGTQESYVFFNYTMTFGKGKELNYRTGGSTYPEDFPYFLVHSASYLGSSGSLLANSVGFNCTMTPYFFDD